MKSLKKPGAEMSTRLLFIFLNAIQISVPQKTNQFQPELQTFESRREFESESNLHNTRRFPEAIIIGVKKGGTRALLEYLRINPLVKAPGPEVHFFDRYYDRGLEWYRKQMPPVSPNELLLEKTPSYFITKLAPERVYKMNPKMKLLVVVRDPVTRAISEKSESFKTEELTRKLPGALIIGVKKAGTRALLEYLRLHPDVRAPGPETHFFDRYYGRGLEWYRKQMPPTLPGQLCLEKTPAYFVKKEVPERVWSMSPDTKLLVVVRDPVTRAISDYTQSRSKGKTTLAFEEMVFRDPQRRQIDQHWSAVRIGIYVRHLKKWLPYFSLDQIHFVSGEKLISNPGEEMKKVEKFLGLKSYISSDLFSFNQTKGSSAKRTQYCSEKIEKLCERS